MFNEFTSFKNLNNEYNLKTEDSLKTNILEKNTNIEKGTISTLDNNSNLQLEIISVLKPKIMKLFGMESHYNNYTINAIYENNENQIINLENIIYFKEIRRADEKLSAKREKIESELPRFVATITQELKASRDVLGILENFKKNAGEEFGNELDVLTADMRSSSYEAALTRFEARINSPMLSDITRGLIGVLRGDEGGVYFQMLAHDMKQLELQRLKAQAMKIPPKIRVFSFIMLMCFLMTYMAIIVYEILRSLDGMF